MAGAKAYAAKLQISPVMTRNHDGQHSSSRAGGQEGSAELTGYDSSPPYGIPQVYETVSFKAVPFATLHQSLSILVSPGSPR